jgi:hypothetical protein
MGRESENRPLDTGTVLHPGDLIPRFEGATVDGREVRYEQLWQHRNVVLFVLSADLRVSASSYIRALEAGLAELKPSDTSLVVSDHTIDRLPLNSVVIADRWGEIVHTEQLAVDPAAWPSSDDILEWVNFIRVTCPECPP